MTEQTTCPPGRWEVMARRRAAFVASPVWHTSPERLTLLAGNVVLAVVLNNGRVDASQRWMLRVTGWDWLVRGTGDKYSSMKHFATRTGAQIEADDIIAAAADWSA